MTVLFFRSSLTAIIYLCDTQFHTSLFIFPQWMIQNYTPTNVNGDVTLLKKGYVPIYAFTLYLFTTSARYWLSAS